MWTYQQHNGQVTDPFGMLRGQSYAGHGEGRNNPVLQDVHAGCRWNGTEWEIVDGLAPNDWGPLPCGIYTMREPEDTPTHGPYVLWLTPDAKNEMFNRSGFGIHGDSIERPGLASLGCICTPRAIRVLMWEGCGQDHRIQVIR